MIVALIVASLGLQAWLIFVQEFNWDEFYFLGFVHDYLRGVEHHGRLGVLYSNKDYGCEWDYDWKNKRFRREDNTKFAVNIAVYAMTS